MSRMLPLALACAVLAAMALASRCALAQAACVPRDQMAAVLLNSYQERPAVMATWGQSLLEVFVSPGGETWSLVETYPGGMSCLVGAGENWTIVPPAPAPVLDLPPPDVPT